MNEIERWPLISADNHVIEPPTLWQDYIEPAYRDLAPRLVSEPEHDAWYIGDTMVGHIGIMAAAGIRFDDPTQLKHRGRWESIPKSAYDPDEYAKAIEIDGMSAAVLYPTWCLFWLNAGDVDLVNAICRAYNRWLSDFCAQVPECLHGVALILTSNVDFAIRELRWAKEAGMVGALIPVLPGREMPHDDPRMEPFWALAEDLQMPLSLHIGAYRPGTDELDQSSDRAIASANQVINASIRSTTDLHVRRAIATLIFSGVFERYPKLKVVSVEYELGWVPHFLNQMDFTYQERQFWTPVRFSNGRKPSDIWSSNIFITFMEDTLGVRLRNEIGVDNMMWGSDFPHSESTWPESRRILGEVLEDVPLADQRKMTNETAARLYCL